MSLHVIKKGLDLPIKGAPEQVVDKPKAITRVGIIADNYVGMKPRFVVQAGDAVKRGQALFEDKKTPGVFHTAPGAGIVTAINRGARRALQSVVIELSERERSGDAGAADTVAFPDYSGAEPGTLSREQVAALLQSSGLWTALRTRPFSKVAAPGTVPHALFITAADTAPLAPSLDVIAEGRQADLDAGLTALTKLTDGATYFCKTAGGKINPSPDSGVKVEEFQGPHPSGLAGLHIHTLDAVSRSKTAWYIGLQDVLAIGVLFRTGALDVGRTISLAGPGIARPRLIKTRLGAATDELVAGELTEGEQRIISGSVLSGRIASGEIHGYLGRFDNQVCALREGREREFLGWLTPGPDKFSVTNLFVSGLLGEKRYEFTTTTNGSERAMMPIGTYEKIMPMDILPTFLLRSLIVGDLERAEELGALELDEEDLALCTFVCPGKYDYGPILRKNLMTIEKEG